MSERTTTTPNLSDQESTHYDLATLVTELDGELVGAPLPKSQVETPLKVIVDASKATRGSAFVAIKGVKHDGHDFIGEAVTKGALVIVASDRLKISKNPGVSTILVKDTRVALSRLAAIVANEPSEKLRVIGVTGTNGKTTTNWLVFEMLTALGFKTVRLGTLGTFMPEVINEPDTLTSPDALYLHDAMKRAKLAGATHAVMEVSSHALSQHRVDDVAFEVGIFTNLTRDHLDYHGDMASYFAAKRRLFELVAMHRPVTGSAVANIDTEHGVLLADQAVSFGMRNLSFGKSPAAALKIVSLSQNREGSEVSILYRGTTHKIKSNLIGTHNAYNLCGAFAGCVALGISPKEVALAMSKARPVPGRLEPVTSREIGVYVDYAHTPDALLNVLKTVREVTSGKLWVVFGCGGDRDRGKRPQMADVASQFADKVVVTSDNPRTENAEAIINEILSSGVKATLVESDRRLAIAYAISNAEEGDSVLIAGKGHEDYQIIGTTKHHFSDVEEAKRSVLLRNERSAA